MSFSKYLKLIQNIKKNDQGFTLVELLVVIIIIGVLFTISLPGFLNQAAKARGAEAKSGLGAINRSQQAYRFENKTFASQISDLDIRVKTKNYNYSVSSSTKNTAAHQTIPQKSDLKQYSSWVEQNSDVFSQIICESKNTSMDLSVALSSKTCPSEYTVID